MWKYNSNYGSLGRLARRGRGGRIIPKKKSKRDNFQRWNAKQGNEVHNILPYVLWISGWEELASIKELKKKNETTHYPDSIRTYFVHILTHHILLFKYVKLVRANSKEKKIILVFSLATVSMKHHRYFDLLCLKVV